MKQLPLAPRGERPTGRLRYVLLAVGVVLLGLAGYAGYATYPRFQLPSVAGAALLALAAGAGVASFFSPCAFPLLLTLLARHAREAGGRGGAARAVVFSAAFSVGIVAFLGVLGVLIGLGGRGLASSVTFLSPTGIAIRITVRALLVVLGLIQAEVLPGSFHGLERSMRRWRAPHQTGATGSSGRRPASTPGCHMIGRVGRFRLESDEPADRGGTDTAPTPLQYLLFGVAT
jgi:MFS family permease